MEDKIEILKKENEIELEQMNKKVELNVEKFETKSIEFKALIEQLKTEKSELEKELTVLKEITESNDLIVDAHKSELNSLQSEIQNKQNELNQYIENIKNKVHFKLKNFFSKDFLKQSK